MASIIEGYNYDIFISYRQKDNKGERWVSDFVEALKTELESTFKEDINVYFDINPSDYLLETYDVDASLKDKLKCLVFIPILSRTYCDPKAFAWEYEFKAFVEQASKDHFGLKIKLPNGNVANRILPIQIHDLKSEDKGLFEIELGGLIRAIEFIYKEAGVNRPLTPKDSEDKNLNRTNYRNQINKVANAIDEIISTMIAEPDHLVREKDQPKESSKEVSEDEKRIELKQPAKGIKSKFLIPIAVLLLLIIAGIIAYPKIFKRNTLEKLRASGERISVAVMPFQNMTNDTTWNVWQNGIQNELITSLTNSKDLKVRSTESINNLIENKGSTNYASITPSMARNISQKLDASVFILGSMKKVGGTIRLNAQLIDSKTEEIFKSFQINGTEEKILYIADSLSKMIRDFLIISIMEKEIIRDFRPLISTNSTEAYKYYMFGNQAYYKGDLPTATEWYLKAIDIDSTFFEATRMLIYSLGNQGLSEESRKLARWYYEKRDQMSEMERLWAEIINAKTLDEKIKYFKLLIAIDDEMPVPYANLAGVYVAMRQYDNAISLCEKEIEIYDKWGVRPRWVASYTGLGRLYHLTGQYKKERKIYNKAEEDFPDAPALIYRQAILALSEGKTKVANDYIERYISFHKENSASDVKITTDLASIYEEAGLFDKAEDYYRKTLSLEPDNTYQLNKLAWFLIDKDRNVQEGLELIEKARELNIDEYFYVNCMGYGLLKLGKYKEALKFLEKSDSLKPGYNHDLVLQLEAAKKAVARQK